MNSVSETLLSAVDVLVDEAVSKLEFDRTVLGEIWSIVNLDIGEYKVKYSGNIFSAFSNDLTVTYQVKDLVYITVPEGNFSGRKVILGKVKQTSLSYGLMVSLSNSISNVSPLLHEFYGYNHEAEYGVVAGAPHTSPLSENIIFEANDDTLHDAFKQYSNNYELIRIKGSFLTAFHCEHNRGNYGLEVLFFTKSDDIVAYKLDINSFIGDPYSLSVYSPQAAIIKALLGYLTGIKCIKLFEENFDYDNYIESGIITDKLNRTVPNIFVKNIELAFVEEKDLTENLYYLNIATPRGNSFTTTITSLDLMAQLIYQGENILSEKNCECKWYERKLDVMIGDNLYEKIAGVGWAPVLQSQFGAVNLDISEIEYFKQYKVVVIYNQNVTLSEEITVYNLVNGNYDFELAQETRGEEIELYIKNNKNSEVLVGDWYYSYPDGSYLALDIKKDRVVVTNLLLYSSVTFYCGVYDYLLDKIVGTLEYTILSSEEEADVTISYEGEDIFRYDANGDVTYEDSEKERTLQAILTWKDGTGNPYKMQWISPDGLVINNKRQTPELSMLLNLWVDNNNILHYTIRLKYNINYNNNTIIVRIITVDEKVYDFKKEILFLKDGDLGTNGTTYIIAVRPVDTATGLKLSGLHPLIYRGGWVSSLPLKCFVYKDGQLINDDINYNIKYEWTGINVSLLEDNGLDVRSAIGEPRIIEENAPPYVKVLVSINDIMNSRSVNVYCFYPIDVAVSLTNKEIESINIENIPSYIKYTASGINPSFYNKNIIAMYEEEDYTEHLISLSPDILDLLVKDDGLTYLKPASSFIFENNTIGLLKCDFFEDKYLLHPIMLYLDNYGNEAINGWDGTSLELNEEGGYILAPQIGAGLKDSFNRFTGVVMGKDTLQLKIGIYGYLSGNNTFGLMEDGKAFFGAKNGGGQIIIDGTTAKIEGGDGGDNATGMTITLADLSSKGGVSSATEAIKLGGGVFKVLYDGSLYASSADITGKITANEGYIGGKDGWVIAPYRIYSSKSGSTHVELNSDPDEPYAIWAGSTSSSSAASTRFAVTKLGALYAKIGNIGGWKLASTRLTANNGRIGMASSGSYCFWSGADTNASDTATPTFTGGTYFYVTSSGELSCRNATVRGSLYSTSGEIGGWTISPSGLYYGNSVYISPSNGIKVGANFSVTGSGLLTCNNAVIGGTISAKVLNMYQANILSDNELQGNIYGYVGMLGGGYIDPNTGAIVTYNLGFRSIYPASVRIDSGNQVAITAARGSIFLLPQDRVFISGQRFEMNVPAEQLMGIYARFA